MKNPCGKTRKVEDPYEIWEGNGFEYRVLKSTRVLKRKRVTLMRDGSSLLGHHIPTAPLS